MKMQSDRREISKIYKRRDRYETPDWQRQKVWNRSQKQLLIDSILRGWKLPKFYFQKVSDNPEIFWIVDGQQRLNAIFEFFGDELSLSEDSAKEFGGHIYRELPPNHSDNFDDFEIQFDVIEASDEGEVKKFFQRLQKGYRLTSSEQLNSEHSNLTNFCRSIAEHPFFAQKVALKNYRYAHFDVATKVAAIEIEGLGVGLRFKELKTVFSGQASFSFQSLTAQRIKQTFDYLDVTFPQKSGYLRNRTVIQTLATVIARLIESGKAKGHEHKIHDFFNDFMKELAYQVEQGQNATDQDYILFQKSISSNVKSGAKTRHEIMLRKMLAHAPVFFEMFGSNAIVDSGLQTRIKDLGDSMTQLIAQINTEYSARHGRELIEPTTKILTALNRIGKMAKNYSGYQTLIDDLYFTFHEGFETRLADKRPQSFQDIKDLRTDIQHDLGRDSTTKRIRISSVFKKYAGSNTPSTVAPERFPIVHVRLLTAIEGDLRQLLQNIDRL